MADSYSESAATAPAAPARQEFYVVGIGASAGALGALEVLLASMPANPGFACVIVVHLSPKHESHLAQLLQQRTSMPVQQVTSTVALEPNRVYVIPPNANLDTIDTHLRLTELESRRGERAPIDHFLRTLASTRDGTAIGVILTGTGSDGSIGLRHIRKCGGLAIAQDPGEAEFDSMPRNAIATGMVDLILPLQRISEEILRFCHTRPELPEPDDSDGIDARNDALLARILSEMRTRTQQDFGMYKRATLVRRLRRRMQLHHVTTCDEYLDVLMRQPQETEALTNDLLLVPTEFFRDPAVYCELEQKVIPAIFDRKRDASDRVRIWSIGCATGEEAYSLAILLIEESTRRAGSVPLQIFASDLSEKVLETARAGVYPREISATVSADRLERFFARQAGFYRVSRAARDVVLFASHDLFMDPPFGHIDLIVCRTFLCELQPEVRQGVLNLFHYALEPDGLLLVGPQDEVNAPGLFEMENWPLRLYRRVGRAHRSPELPACMQPFGPMGVRRVPLKGTASTDGQLASLYLSAMEPYTPASVLIDADNDVVHFSSNAARYLQIPGGELTQDLALLVGEPIRTRLLDGLQTIRQGARCWRSDSFLVPTDHGPSRIILHLEPVTAAGLILVVFDDRSLAVRRDNDPRTATTANMANLEAGLRHLQTHLQGVLRTTPEGEENPIARARLQDATAELRSVLEELANSKEELQAVNEELAALSEENQRRVNELAQISTDLQHLLASTGLATLFLDIELRIVRFTPLLGELFGLRLTDTGRPICDLTRLAQCEFFEADARRVLEQQQKIDREVATVSGRWYLRRMLPYRTEAGHIEGVVATLIDITERKGAEQAVQQASRNKDEFLAVLAHELRNPLAPISAGIEVLKTAPGDRRVVERIAQTMGRQTKQLVRLVDDLLEVSRISGGKLRLKRALIDLHDVINDAIASAKPSIESAAHKLGVKVSPEPIPVNGDSARLTQVLSNLLSNAVRYTPHPGVISVVAAREDGEAVLTVKDDGIGIPQESLAHVFEMFYQGRNAPPGFGGGLGIGLTLAKTLVEMHGGTITVDSAGENRGSLFTIRLPLARPVLTEVPLASNALGMSVNVDHRILIVDDNVDAAETLCMLMKQLGEREVHTASSGQQALEAGPELQPDIVLLDLMMPEMDGYEVARRMRSEPWGKDLLLVALSGWGHEEHRQRSKEAGFDRHVTKPADLAALQTVLNESRH